MGKAHRWTRHGLRIPLRDPLPPRDGDGDGGEGGGGGGGGGGTRTQEPDLGDFSSEAVETARTLIKRHGHPLRALATLATENHSYRERHREDQEAIKDLKGKLPTDGSVAVPKGEAALLEDYKALGALDEVKKKVQEHGDLVEFKDSTLESRKMDQVAGLMDWKGSVLNDLAKAKGFTVTTKTEKVKEGDETKEVPVPYAVRKDPESGKTVEVKLEEFATNELVDYIPSLKREEDGGTQDQGRTPWPGPSTQKTQDGGKPGGLVDKHLEKKKEREKGKAKGNPLLAQGASD